MFAKIVWVGVCLGLFICSVDAVESMPEVLRQFRADQEGLRHFYGAVTPSNFSVERLDQHYKEWQEKLQAVGFEALDQQGRIDYLLLRDKLVYERAVLAREMRKLAALEPFMPFRKTILELERARGSMQVMDAPTSAKLLSEIPEQVKKLRQRLKRGRKEKDEKKTEAKDEKAQKPEELPLKADPILAKRAAEQLDELRNTLKAWNAFYDGYIPDFSWWMKKPYEDAAKSLEDYSKYLREELAGLKGKDEDPILGEPIGAQGLAEDLAHEAIAYTPEELLGIAEKEFAWCEARMKEAAADMGCADWKAALAKIKAAHELPGKQDQYIVQQAHEAIEFVKSKDLVSVPKFCEETWRITMISIDAQRTMPYAAYSNLNILAAYAREGMTFDEKQMSMRGNNRHFTRIVTAHELIPGHHLQNYYAQRYNTQRDLFWSSFYVEGWALYWELKLWDMGYARSPEDRVGMLFWRMHRCARILVTLKFHLGQMKPKEMIDFIVDRVGHEKFGATSEVRRFMVYPPLYQCGYMTGGMQLRSLHNELVPAKMTEREFNDAVLKLNVMPIEYVRAALTGAALTRDWKANWRFGN